MKNNWKDKNENVMEALENNFQKWVKLEKTMVKPKNEKVNAINEKKNVKKPTKVLEKLLKKIYSKNRWNNWLFLCFYVSILG